MDLIHSSLKIFFAKVLGSLISFISIIIFSRELGASPLGVYYPFIALLGIFTIPADFGIRSAVEKRLSEGEDVGSYLATAISLKVPPLFLISILLLLLKGYIEQYLGADLAFLLILALFVQEAAKMSLFVLRGELRVGETAVIQLLQPSGWLIVGYAYLMQGYGVTGLIYGYIAGNAAMLFFGWWKVSIQLSRPTLRHARSLIDYGKFSMISAIGGHFYSWMDVVILSLFVSLGISSSRADIGAYENAWRISLIVLLLSKSVAKTIFPQISRWDSENATERVEEIIPTALLPALLLIIPAFAGSIVLAEDILRILFAPEFTVAWVALIILMGEKILQGVHVVLGRSLQAINRPDLAAYATVVAVAVNLILNIILIWKLGIVGAALATAISFAVNTFLHAYYLTRFITIKFPIHEAIWGVGASIIMAIVVYFVRTVINVNTIYNLLSIVMIGAAVYGILILTSVQIRTRTRELLRPILAKWIPS